MENKSFEGGRVAKKNFGKRISKKFEGKSDAYFLEKFSESYVKISDCFE
jgi:hypothetical protein